MIKNKAYITIGHNSALVPNASNLKSTHANQFSTSLSYTRKNNFLDHTTVTLIKSWDKHWDNRHAMKLLWHSTINWCLLLHNKITNLDRFCVKATIRMSMATAIISILSSTPTNGLAEMARIIASVAFVIVRVLWATINKNRNRNIQKQTTTLQVEKFQIKVIIRWADIFTNTTIYYDREPFKLSSFRSHRTVWFPKAFIVAKTVIIQIVLCFSFVVTHFKMNLARISEFLPGSSTE